MSERDDKGLHSFSPGARSNDPVVAYWLGQASLRLRRELTWCWFQRTGEGDPGTGVLPPVTGVADDILMWSRSDGLRQQFFSRDGTAAFLSNEIDRPAPAAASQQRGDWCWLATALALDDAEQFVLALVLAWHLDPGIGPVCAAACNDINKPWPTLALAQRLWDQPEALMSLLAASHTLLRYGLLLYSPRTGGAGPDWHQALSLPGWLAGELAGHAFQPAGATILPGITSASATGPGATTSMTDPDVTVLLADIRTPQALCRIPLVGPDDADYPGLVQQLATILDTAFICFSEATLLQHGLPQLLGWCWMRGLDAVLPWGFATDRTLWPLALPLRVWHAMAADQLQHDDAPGKTAALTLRFMDYHSRLATFNRLLGARAGAIQPVVEDCARRFRFSETGVQRVVTRLKAYNSFTGDALIAACRAETRSDLQQYARAVVPRFVVEDMVLPAQQRRQFEEVCLAMESLTRVHYRWGTARVWNESGLSVLFCGPPGTGKTMAAEALASRLQLDMYRIDLAQVVSKYIGETEKNLRLIFDAAEASDCLLFFDEADALFGKRTDVKDAHDRYANIEVSYLLERMERFRGLAILASNRRKDMDEAFMRRLRYIIEFPLPDVDERERLWRQGFPEHADTSDLDFRFLARQFSFSGGHIHSVIFNTCLQADADPQAQPAKGKVGKPTMQQTLLQVRRELQKLNRGADDELFGIYARLMKEKVA